MKTFDLALGILLCTAHVRTVKPQGSDQRKSLHSLRCDVVRFREVIHVEQLPGECGPGLPKVRTGLVAFAQGLEKLIGVKQGPGMITKQEQAVAEDNLPRKLLLQKA